MLDSSDVKAHRLHLAKKGRDAESRRLAWWQNNENPLSGRSCGRIVAVAMTPGNIADISMVQPMSEVRIAGYSEKSSGVTRPTRLVGAGNAETTLANGLCVARTGRTYGCKRFDSRLPFFLANRGRPHMDFMRIVRIGGDIATISRRMV